MKPISSGDPKAIELLESKIRTLELEQERMVTANKVIRDKRLSREEKVEELQKLGCRNITELLDGDFMRRVGYPSYRLTNNNAVIREAKRRLAHLQAHKDDKTDEKTLENGVRIVDNVEANRVQVFFEGKPSEAVRTALKRHGFRWTPTVGAWQAYRSARATRLASEIGAAV